MNNHYISESSIHYVTGLLQRYEQSIPAKHHADALAEFRALSNKLLDTLEKPMSVGITRHRLKHD